MDLNTLAALLHFCSPLLCCFPFIGSLFLHHSSSSFGYPSIVHQSGEEGAIREATEESLYEHELCIAEKEVANATMNVILLSFYVSPSHR